MIKAIAEQQDKPSRPDLLGYNRIAAALLRVETAIVVLQRISARSNAFPLPLGPEYPAERYQNEKQDEEFGDLLGDIFVANPKLFGSNTN